MLSYKNLPIKHKLVLMVLLISGISVLLTVIIYTFTGVDSIKKNMAEELSSAAKVIGSSNTAALLFNDKVLAEENLKNFRANQSVAFSCLYDKRGNIFSYYTASEGVKISCPPVNEEGNYFTNSTLKIFQKITQQDNLAGYIFVEAHLDLADNFANQQLVIAGVIVFLVILVISYPLALKMQHSISDPIVQLVNVTKDITDQHYSAQTEKRTEDELAILVEAFNIILSRTESLNNDLLQNKSDLQNLVKNNAITLNFFEHESENISASAHLIAKTLENETLGPIDYKYHTVLQNDLSDITALPKVIKNSQQSFEDHIKELSKGREVVNVEKLIMEVFDQHIVTQRGQTNMFCLVKTMDNDIKEFSSYRNALEKTLENIFCFLSMSLPQKGDYLLETKLHKSTNNALRLSFNFSKIEHSNEKEDYSDENFFLDLEKEDARVKLYNAKFYANINNGSLNINVYPHKVALETEFST